MVCDTYYIDSNNKIETMSPQMEAIEREATEEAFKSIIEDILKQ